jgi:hypothetical protein
VISKIQLSELSRCGCESLKLFFMAIIAEDGVVPGAVIAIQTFGDYGILNRGRRPKQPNTALTISPPNYRACPTQPMTKANPTTGFMLTWSIQRHPPLDFKAIWEVERIGSVFLPGRGIL